MADREPGDDQEPGVQRRPCAKCGCPLAIVMGPNGKKIPLDVRTQVYSIGNDMTGAPLAQLLKGAHPTHFATCPEASAFSKKKGAR